MEYQKRRNPEGLKDMANRKIIGIALFAIAALVAPVYAHHGTAASYDQKKLLKVEGIVKEFLWRNPHSALFLNSKDPSGKAVEYSIEMGSPNVMAKSGLTRNTFKPGDQVIVNIHPSFTNPLSGECGGCQMWVNGKPVRIIPSG